jgi:RimJ/RimL family protein N-acetyltransferase
MGCINKINRIVSIIGITGLLKRLVYSRHEEIMQEIDLQKELRFTAKHRLTMHDIEEQHIPRLASLRKQAGIGGEDPAADLHEYLNNGCHGFMAELEEEIIGYIWWGDHKTNFSFDVKGYEYYVKELGISPGDVYGFDFFIVPAYRGKGYAIEIIGNNLKALKNLGYKRDYGYVHKDNVAARWIYKIIGFRDVKKIVVRRVFLYFLFKNSKLFIDPSGLNWLFKVQE